MGRRLWLVYWLLPLFAMPPLAAAQSSTPAGSLAYSNRDYGLLEADNFVGYCARELYSKFENRLYGISPSLGQQNDLLIWLDSTGNRFAVTVDFAEQNWVIERPFSIPPIVTRFNRNYRLEVYVRIIRLGNAAILSTQKYVISVNGRKAVQIMHNDPDDDGLVIPLKERVSKEKRALKLLASRVSADVYDVITKATG